MSIFYITKTQSILNGHVALENITHKDTETYFGILLDNNSRKWICRVKLGEKSKSLILPKSENKTLTIPIKTIDDLFLHGALIIESATRFNNTLSKETIEVVE